MAGTEKAQKKSPEEQRKRVQELRKQIREIFRKMEATESYMTRKKKLRRQ
jgi:uncharacterized protein YdhG (YjbR/CyaY superfamily)